ncbi:MAG: DUF2062 domain-containing protein [Gallionellaceae bacterium]|nr:DUF2062 domain-containing protein [Gallionellaceae bacterium]
MPKLNFKKHLPTPLSIQQNRWLQPIAHWLNHHNLWHFHRRSVAGGVAVGLFCGLVPGPLQMLCAALFAVLFRVNLPIAFLATLYTNPLTIVPLYVLAYQLGAWVLGQEGIASAQINTPDLSWDNWFFPLIQWMASLGKSFALGLPLLAILLAGIGYIVVRIGWRFWVLWELSRRRARRHQLKEK